MTYRRLSRTRFRDALAKGFGRALVAVRAQGRLLDEEAVLDACLHNRSYDPQVEGSRAPWMMEILSAAGTVDRFQAPILSALSRSSDVWDLHQLCDFAEAFAHQGHEQARSALYDTWQRKPDSSAPWLAEEQIIRLDGLDGFRYLAGWIGAAIRAGEDDFDLENLVRNAEGCCGSDAVAAALADAAVASPDLRAFRDRFEEERRIGERDRSSRRTLSDRVRGITAEEIVAFVENRDSSSPQLPVLQWGRSAGTEARRKIVARLLVQTDPDRVVTYLKILSRAPLPDLDERLIGLSAHADETVRRWAFRVLAANRSPQVRALALRRLEAGQIDGATLALYALNYAGGDHKLIVACLTPRADPHEMHSICSSLGDIFENNDTKVPTSLMHFAYEHTPCSCCRQRFVSMLLKVERLPARLRNECRFDASTDVRELVADE